MIMEIDMTDTTANTASSSFLTGDTLSDRIKDIDKESVGRKLLAMSTAAPLAIAVTAAMGAATYLAAKGAGADHLSSGIQNILGVGAIGFGALAINSAYETTKEVTALVISLGKDAARTFKSISGLSDVNTELFSDKQKNSLKNINAVLSMMDEKGKKAYLVGEPGKKPRVTDEAGKDKFIAQQKQNNTPFLFMEDDGVNVSISQYSGDQKIGAEKIVPVQKFIEVVGNITSSILSKQSQAYADALDETDNTDSFKMK